MRLATTFAAFAALSLLPGCVAAVIPLAAVGAIGKTQLDRDKAREGFVEIGAVNLAAPEMADEAAAVEAEAETIAFVPPSANAPIEAEPGQVSLAEQIRRDAGVSDPVTRGPSPYSDFVNFAADQARRIEAGEGGVSTVLVPRPSLDAPQTISCRNKPPAVMIDIDPKQGEPLASATVFRNNEALGEALKTLRAQKISVIWISDMPLSSSAHVQAMLTGAGYHDDDADDFLFLNRGGSDRKQRRRWEASDKYCIVAMAGDYKGDFDELYDYLLRPEAAYKVDRKVGQGWFIVPAPLQAVGVGEDIDAANAAPDEVIN